MATSNKSKLFIGSLLAAVAGIFFFGSVFAASFNNDPIDLEMLTLENRTTNPAAVNTGSANWRDPISASGGDAISFRFYYHNTEEGTVANNVRLRIAYPSAAGTSIVTTGSIVSNNTSTATDTATINVSSAQTLTFESTAKWYPNQTTSGETDISVTNNGSYIEVNIGDIAGGWPAQGNVVFRATISNNSPVINPPTVSAGSNLQVNESSSVVLSGASATDPGSLPLTYSWSCTGGTLSSSSVLNPTYNAPAVSADTTYTCTLTATNSGSVSASSQVSILVRETSGGGSGGGGSSGGSSGGGSTRWISIDAGTDKEVYQGGTVVFDGYAYSQYGFNPLQYTWSCAQGSLSDVHVLKPTYTAPSVSEDTQYACTLTVKDTQGYSDSDSLNVMVRKGSGSSSGATGPLSVSTDNPESVTSSSAVLRAQLVSDGGYPADVRFAWGRTSSYGEYTDFIRTKNSGNSIFQLVSGLIKGKAYHYRAEANNVSSNANGMDVAFVTRPDSPTGVSANGLSSSQIMVKWVKSPSSCYTLVARDNGRYPADPSSGTVVYYGTGSSVVDNDLVPGSTYYYHVWAVACDQGLTSYSSDYDGKAFASTMNSGAFVASEQSSDMVVEVLGRNETNGEKALNASIKGVPGDEIEIDVLVTPIGTKSLSGVKVKNVLPAGLSYIGGSDLIDAGSISLGGSKAIVIKAKIGGGENFSYGENALKDSVSVSADNVAEVNGEIGISVTRTVEGGAGLISFINWRTYSGILSLLFIIICLVMMWLLIDRKRGKECLTEKASSTKIEKSKYFNIK